MASVIILPLLNAAATLEARLADHLADHGLGPTDWRVLATLYAAGPQPPSALAERLGLTRGGVTRIADRLRVRRLLVRAAAGQADRRFQTLALTGGGARLVDELAPIIAAAEAAALAALSTGERAQLATLLETLSKA